MRRNLLIHARRSARSPLGVHAFPSALPLLERFCANAWGAVAWIAMIVCVAVIYPSIAHAQNAHPLSIEEAVQIAVANEPGTEAMRARADAFKEESVAAGQLPDPQLRFGVGNYPIESGGFRTEGMMQAQLGIRQAFPAGDSRALSIRRLEAMASKMNESAAARDRDVVTAVRQSWLDTFYWDRANTGY